MFEFSFAKKYLIPSKKKLSVSLISLLSCLVISLVVWLLLLFLSVTEGIEQRWLTKMTAVNAPIRIVPTEKYYNSHYYLIDRLSQSSNYATKSIYEKLHASATNPHNPQFDEAPPSYWPQALLDDSGSSIDLIKTAFRETQKATPKHSQVNDYQVTAGMIRLNLVRELQNSIDESFVTQASYITALPESNDGMTSLKVAPNLDDLNHALFLSRLSDCSNAILHRIFDHVSIDKMRSTRHRFLYPREALDSINSAVVYVDSPDIYKVTQVILPSSKEIKVAGYHQARLNVKKGSFFITLNNHEAPLSPKAPILSDSPIEMRTHIVPLQNEERLNQVKVEATTLVQGTLLHMTLPFHHLEVISGNIRNQFERQPTYPPLWAYTINGNTHIPTNFSNETGVVIPKSMRTSGTRIGDRATISYSTYSGSAMQEMKIPVYVSGFYDPGAMAMGSRYLLATRDVVQTIAGSSTSQSIDPIMSNGIQVWLNDIKQTPTVAAAIQDHFEKANIGAFFTIIPYYEFEFAKDLIQQLSSDRTLFTLVGIIILGIAACNIVSLLLLLVNDKRREIGIMRAMGASMRSIATLFALCGLFLGIISFGIGTLAALLTLHNIDYLVAFLSSIQGHAAFNVEIYGENLPNTLSTHALTVMAIATPIVSLIAGLFPAIKAARINPTQILRNET